MAEDDGITGLSLGGVRKLIEDKNLPEDLLEAFGLISGAAIALSPLALGPVGFALWPLFEPVNALTDAGKAAIKKLTKSKPKDYVDQARRFAAANTLLTYTAFFDALPLCKQDFLRELKFVEKFKISLAAHVEDQALEAPLPSEESSLTDIIKVPHPVAANDRAAVEFRRRLYQNMAVRTFAQLVDPAPDDRIITRRPIDDLVTPVAALAETVYQAEFLGMAIDYQPFSTWATLQDQADKGARLRQLSDDLHATDENSQLRFELLGAAIHNLDLGLDHLSRAIATQPQQFPDGPHRPESTAARAAEKLRIHYAADVERPVIDDSYDSPVGGPRLRYPGSAAAYVPQAYRQVRYVPGETHLERDEDWQQLRAADDLGPAITRYLESSYSAESPLLILGHPGSGKSLLTRVYAARLQYPRYTVVRVELRDANPDASIQEQVEDQIYTDTGLKVNWADLVDNLPLSPPIVILDGYDELLQATGKVLSNYLVQVQRFQRNALIQNRPVRVIVTSRITLIHKASIPADTTVMRLEPFDESRRAEWIKRWNACNTAYFQQSGVKPFEAPENPKLAELAEQPLLLLMLAIFDSAANALSGRRDLDQTLLYDELLRRFIERELGKGEHNAGFALLAPEERRPKMDEELQRLRVAAIGMFNRQDVKILGAQLDKDLAYFGAERKLTSDLYAQTQSELLLGSFFFIHESRSRLAVDGAANGTKQPAISGKPAPATGPTAFEFLHNTFGEFLAADFILKQVIENAETIRDLTGKPSLEHARQQHLTSPTPHWWACLLYTPLHTRPNILALFREWSAHRLPADPAARAALLSALDDIIRTQLRAVLVGTAPLDLAARATTTSDRTPAAPPYDPLPVLGHVAVYTLNLILLRTYLAGETCTLDEPDLDAGDRPWDRLTGLWRSWFTQESLGALAAEFTATRTGHQLTLEPMQSDVTAYSDSPLRIAYNAAIALADNLTGASLGLHVMSLTRPTQGVFSGLVERLTDEASELTPIADSMRRRQFGSRVPEVPADVLTKFSDPVFNSAELVLNDVEFIDRVVLSPRQRMDIGASKANLGELLLLSRYASAVITHSVADLDSHWLRDLFSVDTKRYTNSRVAWRVLLSTPVAAPILRAAVARLSAPQCVQAAALLRETFLDTATLFDADTAAALVVLAWRGSNEELCARAIDALLRGCKDKDKAWNLLDIPLETWPGLADLFVEAGPAMASRRSDFAAVLDDHLAPFVPVPGVTAVDRSRKLADLWFHALRIGSVRHRAQILPVLFSLMAVGTASLERRRWFLLLFRWARENDEAQAVSDFFARVAGLEGGAWWRHFAPSEEAAPEAIDLDRASVDLTYREAMDLRWALDLWRESTAH